MTFKEKVQSMTAKEIIMAMVEGLWNPYTKIDMGTYGDKRGGVCYGCAATNTICQINGGLIELPEEGEIYSYPESVRYNVDKDRGFVGGFEDAINSLRQGDVVDYNYAAIKEEFSQIKGVYAHLPILTGDYTEEELSAYVELANNQ